MDGTILLYEGNKELKNLTVIIPCYKEDSKLVTDLYGKLTMLGCEVIIIDDGDTMDLPDEVRHLRHRPRMGYGYSIKRGIKAATTPLICTADGDGQHTMEDIQKLYKVYNMVSNCKMVIGQRWGLKEGFLRRYGRKMLNSLASIMSGHYMCDLNSGIRIFNRDIATSYSCILCDTFSFTTSLTMSMLTDGHKVTWLPVDVQDRVYGKSRVRVIQDGLVTLWYILWIGFALRTRRLRAWIRSLFGRAI